MLKDERNDLISKTLSESDQIINGRKKNGLAFILVSIFIILMGCQNSVANEDLKQELIEVESKYDNITNEVINQQTNVGIYIGEESYTLPISKLSVILDNKGETPVGYNNPIHLDKLQDKKWVEIPYNDDFGFTMEAFELKPGKSFEQEIALENLNYELTNGEYRIRKIILVETKNIVIAHKFEIKN